MIILLPKREDRENWCPFDGTKNIKNLLENAWENGKTMRTYQKVLKACSSEHPEFNCVYPTSRPIDPDIINEYLGCLFDFDACTDGHDYIKTELNSIPEDFLVGCISNNRTELPRSTNLEFYHEIINRENYEKCLIGYIRIILHLMLLDLSDNLTRVSNDKMTDVMHSLPKE
jgi:hypothetical protein